MAIYSRTCRTCGVVFIGGPRAWYCPECRAERERQRASKYRKDGFCRHIGDTDRCENCGGEYTVRSGLQKYCDACAPDMARKKDAEKSLAYYTENRDAINPVRNEKRRKKSGKE